MRDGAPPMRDDPERGLAVLYAPVRHRAGLAALLALDDTLGAILRTTREPIVGQMRLAWWHEALSRLDEAQAPAEPVLRELAARVLPAGVRGVDLAVMIAGWETLLVSPAFSDEELVAFGRARGGALFRSMTHVLGAAPNPAIGAAGEGWALADLAVHLSDSAASARAREIAERRFDAAFAGKWSRTARPLGALALLARADLGGSAPGSPCRSGRLLWHRLTGR